MATPTDPTLDTLCTEGWKKTGVTPSAAELLRAKTEFLQEIFNDIWNRSVLTGNTRLKSLQTKLTSVSVKGSRTLDLAEDFDEEMSVYILDGTLRGTAQAGAASTITLASSETTLTASRGLGKYIFTTGGTGSNQIRQITDYNATTKVATVDTAWTVTPGATTTYLIVETVAECDEDNELNEFDYYITQSAGRPSYYAKFARQLVFERPFDLATYGILVRYYQNINQVDLVEGSTTLITRLLRNWRSVLTQGVYWKTCTTQNDTQEATAKKNYEEMVSALLVKEIPYGGEFTGFTL
jgi:hypothetical protein